MNNWIHSANLWSGTWADVLWKATWQGGLFIIGLWLVCKAFKRIPAWARHWLWMVACLQMGVRLIMISPLALPILPPVAAPAISYAAEIPSEGSEAVDNQLLTGTGASYRDYGTRSQEVVASSPQAVVEVVEAPAPERPSIVLYLLGAWALGALLVSGTYVRRLLGARQLLSKSLPIQDAAIQALVAEFSFERGVRAPDVRKSSEAPCALLAGWRKPAIVLPLGAESMAEPELRMAIAHEIAHLERRDLWLSLIPALVKIPFFFHPLAWLAAHETSGACEEVCDIEALRISRGSPAAYARLLLNSAQAAAPVAALGTSFGYRLLRRRITMLNRSSLSLTSRHKRAGVTLIVLAATCALPWTVTAQATKPKSTSSHSSSSGHVKKKPTKITLKKKKSNKSKSNKTWTVVTYAPKPAVSHWVITSKGPALVVGPSGLALPAKAPRAFSSVSSGIAYSTAPKAPAAFMPAQAMGGGISFAPSRKFSHSEYFSTMPAAPKALTLRTNPRSFVSLSNGAENPAPAGTSSGLSGSFASRPVVSAEGGAFSATFEECSLKAVLSELFRASHESFTIKSDVAFDTVTCTLHKVSLESALRAILESVKQPLTYSRNEDGVYQIRLKNSENAGN